MPVVGKSIKNDAKENGADDGAHDMDIHFLTVTIVTYIMTLHPNWATTIFFNKMGKVPVSRFLDSGELACKSCLINFAAPLPGRDNPMRILFIKPKEIGDSLILTPTIQATKRLYPEAEIWVVIRRGCEGILEGCREIDQILALSGVEKKERTRRDFWRDVLLLRKLRSVHFDMVFELADGHRGRLFAILTRATHRYSVRLCGPLKWWERRRLTAESSFQWQARHRVEKDFYSVAEFLKLPQPIPPMVFARERMKAWSEGGELTRFCLLQIGSRKLANRWSREKWREVTAYLLEQFEQVVVSSGNDPQEIADAEWLREELGPRIICTLGKTSWPQVAGLLDRAGLYVGLNTAAMHLATACRCPIVVLFGSTSEEHWYPWQGNYRIVAAESFADVSDYGERHQLTRSRSMSDIQPAQVIEACREMLLQKKTRNSELEVVSHAAEVAIVEIKGAA
jgi:heptosyltransferase-3